MVHILLHRMHLPPQPESSLTYTDSSQPVIPLSIHGYEDVTCNICNFAQPLERRQDVLQMKGGAGGPGVPLQPQGPPGAPHQGWQGGQPDPNAPMNYK